jgi:hypothetical protein
MNSNDIYGVAHHLYNGGTAGSPDTFIGAMQALTNIFPDKPRFQTEYDGINMIQTALLIHNAMTAEEASAYVFWSLAWPSSGSALIALDNPFNSPSSWTYPHGWQLTPEYYAMKHYSYFINPGFKRVDTPGTDPNARVSAYLSPDNTRLVVVMINPNSTSYAVTNTVNGFTIDTSAVYQSVGINAQTSAFASLGSAPANLRWTLPGYSITTVVFDAPATVTAGPASHPNPADGADNVATSATLSWLAGTNATSHQVYFGYSSNAVAIATTNSPEYQGSQAGTNFTPATLVSSGRYFWRVDEMAGTNATAGSTWTFATAVDPGSPPQAAGAFTNANTFVTRFTSYLGQTYRVERSDSLSPTAWVTVADNVPGTGSLIQIPDTGAPLPSQRFYRVMLLSP